MQWPYKYLILVLFFVTQGNLFAEWTTGKGRFQSKKEDSEVFIKKQLLYEARKDIVTKELNRLGYDAATFWRNYNKSFESYFAPIENDLRIKYKGKNFAKRLRVKKENERSKYGRIDRVLRAFSIKKMNRSTKNPNSRYITIEGDTNQNLIGKIYLDFVGSVTGAGFNYALLSSQIFIKNCTWADLGIRTERDLVDSLNSNWKAWFKKKLDSVPIEIVNDDTEEEIRNIKNTKNYSGNLSKSTIVIRLFTTLTKKNEDKISKKRTFSIKIGGVFVDLASGYPVSHFDFPEEERSFDYSDINKLSSKVASFIYSQTLVELDQSLTKSFKLGSRNQEYIEVKGVKSFADLNALTSVLARRGLSKKIEGAVSSFSGDRGKISIFFPGDKIELIKFLRLFNGVALKTGKRISFQEDSSLNYFVLK